MATSLARLTTYAATLQPEQVLFERSGLSSDRYHTLRVLVTRERSLAANDCCQEIAAFECEQPVGVAREITDTAYAELRTIVSGGKPYPVVERWRRVDYAATAPLRGVILQEGLFKTCQDRHRQYLIDCFASPDWIIPKSTGPRQVTDWTAALGWMRVGQTRLQRTADTTVGQTYDNTKRPVLGITTDETFWGTID